MQRVPVRIALDPKEVAEHPLRVGLSMDAKVDVSNTDGRVLADVAQRPARAQTSVFDRGNDAGRRRGEARSSPPTSAGVSAPTRDARRPRRARRAPSADAGAGLRPPSPTR